MYSAIVPGAVRDLDLGLSRDLVRDSGAPLYRQVAVAIRARILAGTLTPGVKLPSSRELAKRLELHRRTVVAAYQLLEREGLVYSGVGQGTFVGERLDRPVDEPRGLFSWEAFLRRTEGPADLWRFVGREGTAPGAIRFTGATADPALFPTELS